MRLRLALVVVCAGVSMVSVAGSGKQGLAEAELERGGTTFDFAALSAQRFAGVFDPQRNILKEKVGGELEKPWKRTFDLPHTNGGTWRVSCRYRMKQDPSRPDRATFSVSDQDGLAFFIPANGGAWQPMSVVARVPAGKGSLTVRINLPPGADFEFKDLTILDETPDCPLEIRGETMDYLDGTYAVPRGQAIALSYYWRTTRDKMELKSEGFRFALELPAGLELVGMNFADEKSVRRETRADGSGVTTFRLFKWTRLPDFNFKGDHALTFVVRATRAPGVCGTGRLSVSYDDGRTRFACATRPLEYVVVPEIVAQKPREYANGVQPAPLFENLGVPACEAVSRFLADCGVTWMIASADERTYELWRSLGISRITPAIWCCNNGYQIGRWDKIPKSDAFVAVNPSTGEPEGSQAGVCPVTVYEGSEFFRTETIPQIRKSIKGADGCWSNWEPYMFARKGCMCDRCCRKFAEYAKVPYDEVKADWPKCIMKGGRWQDSVVRFRALEHAKIVRTIDRIVREATGGEKSLGFIPAVEWTSMSSWWREHDAVPETSVIAYGDVLRWINPWGPYAAYEAQHPYIPVKRKPIAQFFAAKDVRTTVDTDYRENARPKLMGLPQGHQCTYWISQPEHIGMALDAYFFNRWESTVLYYYPRSYDARYLRTFADATTRAAKYEDFVRKGVRTDASVSVRTARGLYAANVRHVSGYLPAENDRSMLQVVSWRLGNRQIVAVMNFWQRGEAFFRMKVTGLKDGCTIVDEHGVLRAKSAADVRWSASELAEKGINLVVPACRTVVFEFREDGSWSDAKSILTNEALDRAFKASEKRLREEAERDAREESATDAIAVDYMPVI